MSEMKISSTAWLAISLRNGLVAVFDLNEKNAWQYLQIQPIVDRSHGDTVELKRHFIHFSPNGQILVVHGQNKQLNVYSRSDFEKTEVWWQLQRIILVKRPVSALNLTNIFLLIADTNGDLYETDLSFRDANTNVVIAAENCIIKHRSLVFDIAFVPENDETIWVLLADQNKTITVMHYPNVSNDQRHCLDHSDAVSHIKAIDNNHILSASDDGILRLWRISDFMPLVLLHSKAFILSSKQVFYTQLYNDQGHEAFEDYRTTSMPIESPVNLSSTIDYSIWKLDVTSFPQRSSDMYIAFSIYAHRSHSIYLTTLTNMKQLANKQRRLLLDLSYGKIVDYCFLFHGAVIDGYSTHSKCYLYVLFDSHTLLKIDIVSILACDKTELFVQSDQTTQEINRVLAEKEFHSNSLMSSSVPTTTDEILVPQLCNTYSYAHGSHSRKRQLDSIEEEQRKKSIAQTIENDGTPLAVNI